MWVAALLCGVICGCGNGDSDTTRFGPTEELRAYRQALDPIALEVSAIEAEVRERAVGSRNEATAANLDAVYRDVRPRLLEALVELDRLEPPARLRDLQGDIRQLIILRLDAYSLVMAGYAEGDEGKYDLAEEKLRQANELILAVNLQLREVDVALGDAEGNRVVA